MVIKRQNDELYACHNRLELQWLVMHLCYFLRDMEALTAFTDFQKYNRFSVL